MSTVMTELSNRVPDNMHLSCLAAMIWGYCEWFRICMAGDVWLTARECRDFDFAREAALCNHAALTRVSQLLGRGWFPQKRATHMLDHALRSSCITGLNLGHHWCFADEDFFGRRVELGERLHAKTMPLRLIQRYLCGAGAALCAGQGAAIIMIRITL